MPIAHVGRAVQTEEVVFCSLLWDVCAGNRHSNISDLLVMICHPCQDVRHMPLYASVENATLHPSYSGIRQCEGLLAINECGDGNNQKNHCIDININTLDLDWIYYRDSSIEW